MLSIFLDFSKEFDTIDHSILAVIQTYVYSCKNKEKCCQNFEFIFIFKFIKIYLSLNLFNLVDFIIEAEVYIFEACIFY